MDTSLINGDICLPDKGESIVKRDESVKSTAGFLLSVFNLMNAIIGSGLLGLSYAMAQLGIFIFFLLFVTVAIFGFYAIVLMLDVCEKTGAKVSC